MELKDMFYIDEKDWHELQSWAGLAYQKDKNEISGLMTAIPQKDGRFKITDVEILKQENSGTSTELDADAVAAYKMKYAMEYKKNNLIGANIHYIRGTNSRLKALNNKRFPKRTYRQYIPKRADSLFFEIQESEVQLLSTLPLEKFNYNR